MKKLIYILLGLLLTACICSCKKKSSDPEFDQSLLYGRWQEGTVFEHYYDSPIDFVLANNDTVQVNGITWDASEVEEDEAQAFNWTLKDATLTQEHVGTFITVPKVYTLTKLTSSELTYEDNFGTVHQYTKVN